jgi:hypothetical protein
LFAFEEYHFSSSKFHFQFWLREERMNLTNQEIFWDKNRWGNSFPLFFGTIVLFWLRPAVTLLTFNGPARRVFANGNRTSTSMLQRRDRSSLSGGGEGQAPISGGTLGLGSTKEIEKERKKELVGLGHPKWEGSFLWTTLFNKEEKMTIRPCM